MSVLCLCVFVLSLLNLLLCDWVWVCVYVGGVVDVECGLFLECRCVWVDCHFV